MSSAAHKHGELRPRGSPSLRSLTRPLCELIEGRAASVSLCVCVFHFVSTFVPPVALAVWLTEPHFFAHLIRGDSCDFLPLLTGRVFVKRRHSEGHRCRAAPTTLLQAFDSSSPGRCAVKLSSDAFMLKVVRVLLPPPYEHKTLSQKCHTSTLPRSSPKAFLGQPSSCQERHSSARRP